MNEDKNNLPKEIESKDEFIKEFFSIQQQEIAVKRDELTVRHNESKLNHELALASISSQEKVELKRGDVYLETQKDRNRLWIGLGIICAIVMGVAMYLNQSDIALRIIEIGGAVLLAYFAGISRGKSQVLEQLQQNKQKDE